MKGKIYKITNKLNGKVYIGQTIQSLEERFQRHCSRYNDTYHFNMPIKRAIHIEYNFSKSVRTLASNVEG